MCHVALSQNRPPATDPDTSIPAHLPWAKAKPFLCPVLRMSTWHLVALFLSEKKMQIKLTVAIVF